jgi:hypothetical protein
VVLWPTPLSRADVNAEPTKLLVHGHGTLTIKVHAHNITALDTTTRLLKSPRAENGEEQAEEA